MSEEEVDLGQNEEEAPLPEDPGEEVSSQQEIADEINGETLDELFGKEGPKQEQEVIESTEPINFKWTYTTPTNETIEISSGDMKLFNDTIKKYRKAFKIGSAVPGSAIVSPGQTMSAPVQSGEKLCPIHNYPMEERTAKTGRKYFSHRLPDGSFCYGEKRNNYRKSY